MQIPSDKIFVCHWGINHHLFLPRVWLPNKYTGNSPYFLSVSCNIGRKNTISVLKAYEQLLKQAPYHDLVLVWRNPPMEIREKYTSSSFKNKVHFVSNITDEELSLLYSSATAMFFQANTKVLDYRLQKPWLPALQSSPAITVHSGK